MYRRNYFIELLLSVFFMLIIVNTSNSYAVSVKNIYSANVSPSDDEALKKALEQVLIKVSGVTIILENPIIKSSLKNPKKYIIKTSYNKDVTKVDFSAAAINNLVRSSEFSVWQENRPQIIYWIALNEDNKKTLLTQEKLLNDYKLQDINYLIHKSQERALPFVFPIEDLAISSTISINQVWNKDTDALLESSKSYMADVIVAINIYQDDLGFWNSDWTVLFNNEQDSWSLQDLYLKQVINKGVDKITNFLMEKYISNNKNASYIYTVEVNNVDTYNKLQYLIKNIRKNSIVKNVAVKNVQGSKVNLEITAHGDLAKLKNSLGLSSFLSVAKNNNDKSEQSKLVYKWVA